MSNKPTWLRRLLAVASLALVALYVVGLVAMMTFSFQTGLILWVVSTLGGIGLLYWLHTQKKREEALSKAGDGARESGDDAGTEA